MSKNGITGDALRSRPLSAEGKANWDLIFKPLPPFRPHENVHRCTCAGCSGNCAGHNCEICCGRACSGEEEPQP